MARLSGEMKVSKRVFIFILVVCSVSLLFNLFQVLDGSRNARTLYDQQTSLLSLESAVMNATGTLEAELNRLKTVLREIEQ